MKTGYPRPDQKSTRYHLANRFIHSNRRTTSCSKASPTRMANQSAGRGRPPYRTRRATMTGMSARPAFMATSPMTKRRLQPIRASVMLPIEIRSVGWWSWGRENAKAAPTTNDERSASVIEAGSRRSLDLRIAHVPSMNCALSGSINGQMRRQAKRGSEVPRHSASSPTHARVLPSGATRRAEGHAARYGLHHDLDSGCDDWGPASTVGNCQRTSTVSVHANRPGNGS